MPGITPSRLTPIAVSALCCVLALPGALAQPAAAPIATQAEGVVVIDSLQELAEYATRSDVSVRLSPGTYRIDDGSLTKPLDVPAFRALKPSDKPKPIVTEFHFSGSRSRYDLTGATIVFNTQVQADKAYYKRDHYKVFITGDGNTLTGLTFHDEGDAVPISGAVMVVVVGNQNTLASADLLVSGSSPYGYGHLLGKGRGALIKMQKQCGVLISGKDTRMIGCTVRQHAFGHAIFMQGASNTLIEDCHVEGELRTTDAMLAETTGPAFEAGFESIYPPGRIMPGQIKALAEDGIRTYASGGLVPTRTGPVTVVNCTITNMRAGVCLGFEQGPSKIVNTTTTGHQERGFSIGTDGVIENCRGDAQYGPLLTFLGPSKKNCTIDLELIDTVSDYPVPRAIEVNGTGHTITLRNAAGTKRSVDTPIVFGESDWGDVHFFRAPDSDPAKYSGAKDCTLINETGLPIVFSDLTRGNKAVTNGAVLRDDGVDNRVSHRE